MIGRSPRGPPTGAFRSIRSASSPRCAVFQRAWDRLEVGGVVVGDVPSYRIDNMPYGGVKESGLGREGVRFAMEDMTEIRNLVIRTPPGA
nr:aldehyde dehydrogenase family protein [Paracoccus sp. S-4012]